LLSGTSKAQAKNVAAACPGIVKGIYYYRDATRRWERKLGKAETRSNFNASLVRSCRYSVWIAHVWKKRAAKMHVAYAAYREKLREKLRRIVSDPVTAICMVFGPYCEQAKAVARCESGYNVYAQNGQYLGLFQMGEHERAVYGHGSDALTQARAAYAYFMDSGANWGPWSCRPY
jgi:hypothetical protein